MLLARRQNLFCSARPISSPVPLLPRCNIESGSTRRVTPHAAQPRRAARAASSAPTVHLAALTRYAALPRSNLLLERLMLSSDAFTAHVDMHSGLLGWWDAARGAAASPIDGGAANMAPLQLPYACKLLFQELQSMNIVPRIQLRHL